MISILGNVITRYGTKTLSTIKMGSDEDKCTYGSFVARKLLESASSAILARMDPSRFLILQEYQKRAGGDYSFYERHPASIVWSGDIVPDKAANSIWSTESSPDKFVRALLGGHLAEISWSRAIERFALDESDRPKSLWLDDLSDIYEEKLRQFSSSEAAGTSMLGVLRAKARENYSALSKGVHLEFVVDETAILDSVTVVAHMLAAVRLVSQLGYLSNHMDSVFTRIETQKAAELLFEIEESFTQ